MVLILYHGIKSNILNRFQQVINRIEVSSLAALLIELRPMFRSDTHSDTLQNSLNDFLMISKNCLAASHFLTSFVNFISTIV